MKQTEENNIPVLPENAAAEARPQDARDTNTTTEAPNASAASRPAGPSAAADATAAPADSPAAAGTADATDRGAEADGTTDTARTTPRRRRSRRKPATDAARSETPDDDAPTMRTDADKSAGEGAATPSAAGTDRAEHAGDDTPKKAAPARRSAAAKPAAAAAGTDEEHAGTSAATDGEHAEATAGTPSETAGADTVSADTAASAEAPARRKRSRSRRRKSAAAETSAADGERAAQPDSENDATAAPTRPAASDGKRTQKATRTDEPARRRNAASEEVATEPAGKGGTRKGTDGAAGADRKAADRKDSAPTRGERTSPGNERKNARQETTHKQTRDDNARNDRPKQRQEPSRRNAAEERGDGNNAQTPKKESRRPQDATRSATSRGGAERPAALRPVKIKPGKKLRRGTVAAERVWALVTGAGTGIGRCYALRLAASGYCLVLAGDRRAPLESVRREILDAAAAEGRRESCEVRICQLDLARTDAAEKLVAWTRAQKISVDLLINNAGIFSFRDILRTPIERIERIVLLHNLTLTKLCRLYASDMVYREAQGHILNMSSFSLWMPFPGLSLYSASKAYIQSFSVSFAREVRESGIRVTAVCPAGVATDLYGLTPRWQRIGLRIGALISADACARRGLRALRRGRRCIVPDWWNRIWIPLCKSVPMTLLRPLRKFTMKFQK